MNSLSKIFLPISMMKNTSKIFGIHLAGLIGMSFQRKSKHVVINCKFDAIPGHATEGAPVDNG